MNWLPIALVGFTKPDFIVDLYWAFFLNQNGNWLMDWVSILILDPLIKIAKEGFSNVPRPSDQTLTFVFSFGRTQVQIGFSSTRLVSLCHSQCFMKFDILLEYGIQCRPTWMTVQVWMDRSIGPRVDPSLSGLLDCPFIGPMIGLCHTYTFILLSLSVSIISLPSPPPPFSCHMLARSG